ncbi:MAG TPA: hypothetical protein H9743_00145 [Candidatus Mediterraneibacter vanvlietii]|nr:hypothetical protein [Candidatus Mediterraneibacter vanvlietii]
MYEGNPVDLQMEKIISADGIFDESTRQCRVFKYDPEEDYIYLELKEGVLTEISLDAKYRCYISTRSELLYCTGVVKERYRQEDRNLFKFRIENGFYNVNEGRKMTKRA